VAKEQARQGPATHAGLQRAVEELRKVLKGAGALLLAPADILLP